jgi:hypothetical protein
MLNHVDPLNPLGPCASLRQVWLRVLEAHQQLAHSHTMGSGASFAQVEQASVADLQKVVADFTPEEREKVKAQLSGILLFDQIGVIMVRHTHTHLLRNILSNY